MCPKSWMIFEWGSKPSNGLCITPFHQRNESSGQSVLAWLLYYAKAFSSRNYA
jgi:hypothetical protein